MASTLEITKLGFDGSPRFIQVLALETGAGQRGVTDGPATIYSITLESGGSVYFKLYNTENVVLGTTVPDMILMNSGSYIFHFLEGILFDRNVYAAAVTTGGTGGVGLPPAPATIGLVVT
jgi:hypothetical protein